MRRTATESATHTTITEVKDITEQAQGCKVLSIRQICIGMINEGHATKVIAERIQALHPDSAAAKKSAKHIAWYKAQLKKEGKLVLPQLEA